MLSTTKRKMLIISKILKSYEPIHHCKKNEFAEKIIKSGNCLITTIHPHSYFFLRKRTEILERIDYVFCDSILLMKVINFFLNKNYPRICFNFSIADYKNELFFAYDFFAYLNKSTKKIFFIGGTQSEVKAMVKNIQSEFKNINIVGYSNGYFYKDGELYKIFEKILKVNPDFVICGIGTIKQEKFLIDLKQKGWSGTGIAVGNFIKQTSKSLHYYPLWFEKAKLRWFYRLINENKMIFRYTFLYPLSIILLLIDIFIFSLRTRRNLI